MIMRHIRIPFILFIALHFFLTSLYGRVGKPIYNPDINHTALYYEDIYIEENISDANHTEINLTDANKSDFNISRLYVHDDNRTEYPSLDTLLPKVIYKNFNVGFGGAYAYPFYHPNSKNAIWVNSIDLLLDRNIDKNPGYRTIKGFNGKNFKILQQHLSHAKYIVYWMTKHWNASWFNTSRIQEAMDQGYIPVFIYWYFADELSTVPSDESILAYYNNNKKLARFLQDLNGTKFVIMEPEFNKREIIDSDASQLAFAHIISRAIDNIKAKNDKTYFSLCLADSGIKNAHTSYASCGYSNCALGDKKEWDRTEVSFNILKEQIDFISFQEMVGQFSRDPENPGTWKEPIPISHTDTSSGIDYLPQRISNLSKYLKDKYNKPVFLPYIAIATATWHDANNNKTIENSEVNPTGWEDNAAKVYDELSILKKQLLQNGLFGFAPMALFDNPRHDYGGYQFFLNNEYHLGIIKSSAEDVKDRYRNGNISFKKDILKKVFDAY